MALSDIPKIRPTKGAVYAMAVALATFTFFFTRSVGSANSTRK